jgi:hypothetical protein
MNKQLLTHAEVNYRQAIFANRRCGVCDMYIKSKPTAGCTLVRKPIRPFMVCDRFEPREKENARAA